MNKAPISGHSTKQEFPDRGSVVQTQCSSNEGVWVVGDINHCDYTARDTRIAAENAEKERQAQIAATPPPVAQSAPTPVVAPPVSGDAKSYIYMHESGNNPSSINPSSGACGLGQALPCSKMPCSLSDYACQDSFFTSYMSGRYGSWEVARSFHLSHGWW